MAWGDVNLLQKTDGTEYLEYTEWQTKSRSGAEPQNIRTVKPKAFSTQLASLEEIQFFLYKFYAQKRPGLMQQLDVPLHVSINHTRSSVFSNNKSYFKSSAMGVNKLKSLTKFMAEKAGPESQRLTNYNARNRMIKK